MTLSSKLYGNILLSLIPDSILVEFPCFSWPSQTTCDQPLRLILVQLRYINEVQKKQKTSWANARVKLHSQVHFWSKKIFGPKTKNMQYMTSSKIFHDQKNFEWKNILD